MTEHADSCFIAWAARLGTGTPGWCTCALAEREEIVRLKARIAELEIRIDELAGELDDL